MNRKFKTIEVDNIGQVLVNLEYTSLRIALIELGVELQNVYDAIFKNKGRQVIELLSAYIYSGINQSETLNVLFWLFDYYKDACITLERKGSELGIPVPKSVNNRKIINFPSTIRAGRNTALRVLKAQNEQSYTAKEACLVRWEEDDKIHTHFTCMGCNANTMVIEEKGIKHQICEGYSGHVNPKYNITIPVEPEIMQ